MLNKHTNWLLPHDSYWFKVYSVSNPGVHFQSSVVIVFEFAKEVNLLILDHAFEKRLSEYHHKKTLDDFFNGQFIQQVWYCWPVVILASSQMFCSEQFCLLSVYHCVWMFFVQQGSFTWGVSLWFPSETLCNVLVRRLHFFFCCPSFDHAMAMLTLSIFRILMLLKNLMPGSSLTAACLTSVGGWPVWCVHLELAKDANAQDALVATSLIASKRLAFPQLFSYLCWRW